MKIQNLNFSSEIKIKVLPSFPYAPYPFVVNFLPYWGLLKQNWTLVALCCLGIVLCSPHSKGQERT